MALKRTVLVVEDNAINRGILAGILSEQYTVLEAENGLAALALLQQHGSDIALILLDMMMPVMDGCTFLAHLRKDEELAQEVIASDDKVDSLFDLMKKRLIEIISKEQADGEMYIDLIMIAKYYERIGDHATNIAEWVLYYLTGTKVSGNKDS